MKIKKGMIVELDIHDLASGGQGVGRVDDMAVFVEQAVPGDRVRAQVTRRKKQYAVARMVEQVHSSPWRVEPPCPYSGICGGCKLQFFDYAQQLDFKRSQVFQAFKRIGGIADAPVHATVASPLQLEYRNKMEFSCADRRWLLPHELGRPDIIPGFGIGLHVPGTFFKVLDIDACLLQPALGNQILALVRRFIRESGVPVYGLRSHEGFWRFLVLRHSVAHDHWMVNIVTRDNRPDIMTALARQLTDLDARIVSIVNSITARRAAVAVGEQTQVMAGSGVLVEKIDDFQFELSANSFFQTNTRGAAQLYAVVRRFAGLSGVETVLDLYCGAGAIAIYLAQQAERVVGMEIVESAVFDAYRNCERNQVTNCRFVPGDIRTNLATTDVRPDVIIIDPPRMGMHADVVKQVMALGAARIVYVSCNPSTQARDVALLADQYRVAEVQPVDMFPHTAHIESVARLEKR